MPTPLETRYAKIAAEAQATAWEEFPDAEEIIVSFGQHDCILDVILPEESKRFVYTAEDA